MEYIYILINFIIAIIVAVITAKITIREFYSKEIWLRKESRYSQVIEHLSILQKYYGDVFDKFTGASELKTDEDSINKEYITSLRELEIVAFSQGFILAEEVSEILNQLFYSSRNQTSNERMGDMVSYFDRMYCEVRDSKKRIIEIANRDLKL